MVTRVGIRVGIESAWREVSLAARRADTALSAASRAAAAAERQARLARSGSRSAHIHARLAEGHRGAQRRQEAAARLQFDFAWRMADWAARGRSGIARPVLMRAVADAVGWSGAVLVVWDHDGSEGLVAASDPTARASHELEVVLGEGPSREAVHGHCPATEGAQIHQRWPLWGPAVTQLGVRAVAGVPLGRGSDPVGSLTVTGPSAAAQGAHTLADVAAALRQSVLCAQDALRVNTSEMPGIEQLDAAVFQPTLHKAVGVLCAESGMPIEDAIALVRARAYAEGRTVADVASDVVRGTALER